jgi:hypothetical protein
MLMTRDYIYVPVFGNDPEGQTNDGQSSQLDATVLTAIRANTRRTVVEVDVPHKVCAHALTACVRQCADMSYGWKCAMSVVADRGSDCQLLDQCGS